MDARHWKQLLALAEKESARLRRGLPAELRKLAAAVPVVFQSSVDEDLAGADIEPDVLGLFVGTPHGQDDAPDPLPPQIFLFLESIWEAAAGDRNAFCDEVRLTYLHELGHFLGLDEDDLLHRGLD